MPQTVTTNQRRLYSRFITAVVKTYGKHTEAASLLTGAGGESSQQLLLENAREQKLLLRRQLASGDAPDSGSTRGLSVSKLIFFPGGDLYKITDYSLGSDGVVYSRSLNYSDIRSSEPDELAGPQSDWEIVKELQKFHESETGPAMGEPADDTDLEMIINSIDNATPVAPPNASPKTQSATAQAAEAPMEDPAQTLRDVRAFLTDANNYFIAELFSMENKLQAKFYDEMKRDAESNTDADFTPYWRYYLSGYETVELEEVERLVHRLRELSSLITKDGAESLDRLQASSQLTGQELSAIRKAQVLRRRFLIDHGKENDPLPILARLIL